MSTDAMLAFQVPEPGRPFALTQRPIPQPGKAEVRVKIHACGICRSDVFAIAGLPGAAYPLIPGHEIAGAIDEIGPEVEGWALATKVGIGWFGGQCGQCVSCRKGDFVTCTNQKAPGLLIDGGYAEYVVVPATALVRIPDGIDLLRAGPLMCAGVTAFNALRRGGASAGSLVAVVGVGGVGHLAIQFARHMGCETIAVSRGRAKEALALKLGAHHFVDALDPAAAEAISALGRPEVVVVTTPGSDEVQRLAPLVAANGRIVVTGFSSDPVRVSSVDLISRNLSVTGSAAGTAMDTEETLRFCLLHGISPVVEEFPFDAADQAYQGMLAGTTHFRAVLNLTTTSPLDARSEAESHDRGQPAGHRRREGSDMQVPILQTRRTDPVLDCPPDQLPGMEELIEATVRWHFSPDTGSAFWLERARTFDFDPLRDVRTLTDLRLFPNVADDFRFASVADLMPKGYGANPPLVGVFESGGVTGLPKRVLLTTDWQERWLAWGMRNLQQKRYPEKPHFLMAAPTGPHLMTHLLTRLAYRQHGAAFTIDLDPRWARKLMSEGRSAEANSYTDHIIDQISSILKTQDVNVLLITPPLLEKLTRRSELVELIRQKIAFITWGGTHLDADTRDLYRTDIFPSITFDGGYGSTMVLGGAIERVGLTDEDPCVFDPFSPYVTFSVVDPQTREDVAYGERGQVLMNHLSKSMFIPNNLERDTAIRIPGLPPQAGDSVADVRPVREVGGVQVVEGVY